MTTATTATMKTFHGSLSSLSSIEKLPYMLIIPHDVDRAAIWPIIGGTLRFQDAKGNGYYLIQREYVDPELLKNYSDGTAFLIPIGSEEKAKYHNISSSLNNKERDNERDNHERDYKTWCMGMNKLKEGKVYELKSLDEELQVIRTLAFALHVDSLLTCIHSAMDWKYDIHNPGEISWDRLTKEFKAKLERQEEAKRMMTMAYPTAVEFLRTDEKLRNVVGAILEALIAQKGMAINDHWDYETTYSRITTVALARYEKYIDDCDNEVEMEIGDEEKREEKREKKAEEKAERKTIPLIRKHEATINNHDNSWIYSSCYQNYLYLGVDNHVHISTSSTGRSTIREKCKYLDKLPMMFVDHGDSWDERLQRTIVLSLDDLKKAYEESARVVAA